MAVPFRVKALYEYSSPHEDDLNFPVGQIITVNDDEDDEWYGGEYLDNDGAKKEGIFPRNFVEKFEPVPPPRPTRTRPRKSEDVPAAKEPEPEPEPEPEQEAQPAEEEPEPSKPEPKAEPEEREAPEPKSPHVAAASPPAPTASKPSASAAEPAPKAEARPPPQQASGPPKPKASGPPPVAEKPASNSFKDRIAAFNKPAAAPVAPFKPGGLSAGGGSGGGGGGFIKKPYVPPPPSRDAYIPVHREQAPQKLYRREEDPEIREQEAEIQEQAEKAGLVPSGDKAQDVQEDDDQPKPTSLKERIALLQKQQMEQAQRHADAAAKKEKPKKPVKKRSDTVIGPDDAGDAPEDLAPLERRDTETTIGRGSLDEQAAITSPPLAPRRKSSKGPAVESLHDGNEADMSGAGDTTEGQDEMTDPEDPEEPRRLSRATTGGSSVSRPAPVQPEEQVVEEDDDEETEEDDVDPEIRRKEELRARMAKMSGGMGFHGMFGAPPPPVAAPAKKKKAEKAVPEEEDEEGEEQPASTTQRSAPPVPTPMALPGMGGMQKGAEADSDDGDDDEAEQTSKRPPPPAVPPRQAPVEEGSESEYDDATPGPSTETARPPPVPVSRPAPPPVPSESRPPPPPPAAAPTSVTEGSESDDELSGEPKDMPTSASEAPRSPPMPPQPNQAPAHPPSLPIRSPPMSPRDEEAPPSKRNSRPPPPIPGSAPVPPPASSRPPPPPPPGGLSRQSTADTEARLPPKDAPAGDDAEEENTEYEGDYDTDIASSAPHKDALKAHARDSSLDESLVQSPTREAPPSSPPPVPAASAPRAVPPPVPIPGSSASDGKRRSVDVPRAAPPPPPTPKEPAQQSEDYDPYNYTSPTTGGFSSKTPKIEEEAYFAGMSPSLPQSPSDRRPPPPTPGTRSAPRTSIDAQRTSTSNRRSADIHRPSLETGFIANDMDLAVQSGWWKQANQLPPVLQGRRDIFFESEESTTTNQGSKTVITREIFVLYQDYSQSVITVRFDPYDQSDVELDQRHEPPPRTLRQDEMEDFYDRFGRQIAESATSKKDTVVGDGTPQGLVMDLLRPLKGALLPVGSRSYGALVYSNMANASTQQHDVIRAGDIVSFRNSKFQGKHGAMHAKYSAEIGKPDHVAVVAEWDGSKKKLRAWEQGRENKKVKQESYKLDDLRSGEVKVWRVVPRTWVGWNIQP